jgi:hypothetical protein
MLRVGAGAAVIPTRVGEPLAGYALRQSHCTASHDPLRARVVRFDDGTTRAALVALDLLYVPTVLDSAVRAAVAEAADVDATAVTVCATHTHCGPANLATDSGLRDRVAAAAGSAAGVARERAETAVLATSVRRIPGISAHRRSPAGTPDASAAFLVARSADGARTIATIVNFACHATVLDHTVTESSADFPGAACRQIERQVGGTALFLQGAAGDVNPVCAAPTHDECERVGGILTAAAVSTVLQAAGLQQGLQTVSPSLQAGFAADHLSDCRLVRDPELRIGWAECAVQPAPPLPPAEKIARARAALAGPPGPEDARLWIQQLRAAEPNLFGVFDPGPPDRLRVQLVRFAADLALLALPGEPFTATAVALRAAAAGELLVAGYAHQSVGYLPPASEWAAGGYEVGCCLYTDAVEGRLRATAADLVR